MYYQGVKAAKPGDKAAKAGSGFKEEVYLDVADAKSGAPVAGEAKAGAKVHCLLCTSLYPPFICYNSGRSQSF